MLELNFIIPAALLILAGCSQRVIKNPSSNTVKRVSDSMYITLGIKPEVKESTNLTLRFVVHNENKSAKSFCKWHTPFEPLMSKYLDVRDDKGMEASYKGPMAKRIMPPPADSYLMVNPNDTLTAEINLSKGYNLEKGKKYTISYNSSGISGLKATNSVSFSFKE